MSYALPLALTAAAAALFVASSSSGADSASSAGSTKTVRLLALGDSYTIGEGVAESERWPMQLADSLRDHGYPTEVTTVARTGWTTDELWAGIQEARLSPPYDLVSLLIGVNNQFRGLDLEEYRRQFRYLLGKAVECAGGQPGRAVVLSIPDWGVTPFGAGREPGKVAAEIDRFNSANRGESRKAGVVYVDITPETRIDGRDPSFIAPDGLHPSGKMYVAWVKLVLPAALEALAPG
jgi:lysophospholipase L1-like esterase